MFCLRAALAVACLAEICAGQVSSLRGASSSSKQGLEENATTMLSYVVGYQQHQHLNCYTGHGGEAIGPDDGLQAGVHSAEECGRAMSNNLGYANSCFVFFSEQNKCFLRKDCNLAACEQGVQGSESWQFDTYTPGPPGSECLVEHGQGKWIDYSPPGAVACEAETCDPGYMTTDMACVPISYNRQSSLAEAPLRAASLEENATTMVSYVVGYEQHQHLNCYTGHGGEAMGPDDGLQAGVNSVDECGKAADSHGYACFVYFWKYNQCFLRTDCNIWACEEGKQGEESYDFDTFVPGPEDAECLVEHGQGRWRPDDHSPTGLACVPEKCDPGYQLSDTTPVVYCKPVYYNKYEHTNCYIGHGGTVLGPTPDDVPLDVRDVEECKDVCINNGWRHVCRCFVFFSEQNKCFRRSECELPKCEIGVPGGESYLFDTYIAR